MNEIEPYGYNSTGRNYNKEFKFKPFSTNIDISFRGKKLLLPRLIDVIYPLLPGTF